VPAFARVPTVSARSPSPPSPASPPSLPFLTRLWFAYVVFFRVLFNGQYAAELRSPKALPPSPAGEKDEKPKMLPEPKRQAEPMAPSTDAALQLLALLQREGRFVDFLEEDVTSFADADIGAAARVVHTGCRKAIREHVKLEPVRSEEEGVRVTLPEPLDAAAVKLTGNVQGKGPFTGTLRHRGWKAVEITMPTAVAGHDARILAQAEVEL
jgi:hypothetical protein